jgi:hypothetical protein
MMIKKGSLAKTPQNTYKLQKCGHPNMRCVKGTVKGTITYLGGGSVKGTKNLSWRETHQPLQRKRKTQKNRESFGEELKLN